MRPGQASCLNVYWLNQFIAQKHPYMFVPKVLSQYWSHQFSCIDCLLRAWLYQGQSILTQRQLATYCTEHYCTWQHCTILGAFHCNTLPNYNPLHVQPLNSKYSHTTHIHSPFVVRGPKLPFIRCANWVLGSLSQPSECLCCFSPDQYVLCRKEIM